LAPGSPWKHLFYLMIDYRYRCYNKELLDGMDIPFKDIAENMKELEFINSYLGGHSITIEGFKKLTGSTKNISVCEIGCGGGDNLNALGRFCKRNNIQARFTGIDINADCIEYAKRKSQIDHPTFIVSDYRLADFDSKPGIIFSSLFCHHFTDDELVEMLQWMKRHATAGFFINDLHRHPVAYNFIKFATKIFSGSYLVKNDAPLSVLRGFRKGEWQKILKNAGITNYAIQWKWAFRYLIMVPANQ
jgi:2-polyprenyl-3-methyl-5-hydroxy-6-metoxy-1,4-benzoquinol methylase